MSNEKLLNKSITNLLRNSFMKWFAIGLGTAVVLGSVVGVSIYFTLPDGPGPDNGGVFTDRLSESLRGSFPDILHMQIGGNASGYIDSRIIWSYFDRVGTSEDYTWDATAQLMFPTEEINFSVNKTDVEGIAQSLYDSIRLCDHVGIWGEAPYESTNELPNMK